MIPADKSTKKNTAQQKHPRYVDCDNCSMQAICQPIGTDNQPIDLTNNYLTRRVEVSTEANSSQPLPPSIDTRLFEQASPLTAIFAVCSGTFKLCQTNDAGIENCGILVTIYIGNHFWSKQHKSVCDVRTQHIH